MVEQIQEPEGLTPGPQTEQLTQNADYDELVTMDPAFGPVAANEEPDENEQAHYDTMYADFTDELFGAQVTNAENMLKSSNDLYKGVSKVAFNILKAVHQRHDQRDGPVPPAALFGEGGMISTAVDEVFSMAQALGLPEASDQDQYTAAQMDIMRLVGEVTEMAQSDEQVNESQELLLDMETADGTVQDTAPLDGQETSDLEAIGASGTIPPSTKNSGYSQAAGAAVQQGQATPQQGLQPENIPPQPQGLV